MSKPLLGLFDEPVEMRTHRRVAQVIAQIPVARDLAPMLLCLDLFAQLNDNDTSATDIPVVTFGCATALHNKQ